MPDCANTWCKSRHALVRIAKILAKSRRANGGRALVQEQAPTMICGMSSSTLVSFPGGG